MSSSPTTVETPLEYITVETYAWPTPERPKRFRQDPHVRKLRHRENQRKFIQRKQMRLEQLRHDVRLLELRLKYLWAVQEEQILSKEREEIDQSSSEGLSKESIPERSLFQPLEAQARSDAIELDSTVRSILLSL